MIILSILALLTVESVCCGAATPAGTVQLATQAYAIESGVAVEALNDGDGPFMPTGETTNPEGDSYEDNQSYTLPTEITPQGMVAHRDYTVDVYASINTYGTEAEYLDADFYRFNVFSNCMATITLSQLPAGKNYAFQLFYVDWYSTQEHSNRIITVTEEDRLMSQKTLTASLSFGSYFVFISGDHGASYDYSSLDVYKLRVSVAYNAAGNPELSELRFNKGAKAVLWKSDYDPGRAEPFSCYSAAYYGWNTDYLLTPGDRDSAQSLMHEHYGDSEVPYADLYLYGLDFRRQLSAKLDSFLNSVSSLDDSDLLSVIVSSTFESQENGTVVTTPVSLGLYVNGVLSQTILDFSSSTSIDDVSYVFALLLPKFPIRKVTSASILSRLRSVIFPTSGSSEEEVFKIPFAYKFTTNTSGGYTDDYADFSVNVAHLTDASSSFLFNGNEIDSVPAGSFAGGHIYLIKGSLDFADLYQSGVAEESAEVNTSVPTALTVMSFRMMSHLLKDEYRWYSFTAPSTGTYSFKGAGDVSLVGEAFSHVVPGHSESGVIAQNVGSVSLNGFYIDVNCTMGSTVFLRVRGNGWGATSNSCSVAVFAGSEMHIHSYCLGPVYYSNSYHKYSCRCGAYVLKPHTVDSSKTVIRNGHIYGVCLDCGASIDLGISGGIGVLS